MFSIHQPKGLCALLIALFLGTANGAAADFRPARGPRVEGEYIVVFKGKPTGNENAAKSAAQELAASHGAQIKRVWESALNGAVFTGINEARARALANHPTVAWVEENGIATLTGIQANPVWGLDRIDEQTRPLTGYYDYIYDGTGINVYVLDSGLRETHNDFGNRATRDFDARPDDGQNGADCNGHGTHVAGTLGGSTYGVAKGVRIHGVRVMACNGTGTWDDIIEGINWVVNNAQLPAVANMSLGGGANDAVDTAVNNAVNAGIFFAIAAGNGDVDACTQSPARAAQAFTVAASNSFDNRSQFSWNASNWGPCVEIFAPGSNILSAWNTSDSDTNTLEGTSMATPHVAGVAALILDEHPNLTPAQVRDLLIARATRNVVGDVRNSPNRLLYSRTLSSGGAPQIPLFLDVQPWMCNGYNDVFWTTADGATYYELYMSSSSSFTTQTRVYQGTATDYLANVSGTRYFRVRSCGPTGCSDWVYGDQAAIKVTGCL